MIYFADRPSSALMAQVTYGAGAVPSVLNMLVLTAGRDSLTLIGLIVVMVVQDPLMALVAFALMPPAMLMLRNLIQRIRSVALDQFAGGAGLMEAMQETLQGLRIVKAFGLEDEMRARVDASVETVKRAANELAWLSNRASPMMEALGGCAFALVFLYGGFRVIEMGATPGELVSFIAAFLLAYEPAKRLARMHLDLGNGLVGVRMLYEFLDAPPSEPDEDKPALRVGAGRVEFKDVDFAYRAGEPVLRGMSFIAAPGRVTAFVGRSGGGKSTALSLLLRFYDVAAGRVMIDGQDLATLSRRSVRNQIAYVGQDVFLFRASIRDNIRFGNLEAGDDEVIAAAKAAHAHDFIMGLPQGYRTAVGEHGLLLSTGERQRVALARALIKNAPIILLDEPTAALDSESERGVQDAIARLCAGRTTLVIAHRLYTITHADCIHVVEDGAVVESGAHQELLRKGGPYASFYRLMLDDRKPVRDHITALAAQA
jgi:ATP-binding cassette, subfamily B, bacterial MsbA